MDVFIAALGVPAVSKETGKLLVGAGYDTFQKIVAATPEQLADIEGLGAIKADKILTGLRGRLDEIERLEAVGVVPVKPTEGGPLAGLSFCFSGSQNRPRKELQAIVENNGGTVRSAVTKGLTYLVLADPESTSSKAQKARKLGTEIISATSSKRWSKKRAARCNPAHDGGGAHPVGFRAAVDDAEMDNLSVAGDCDYRSLGFTGAAVIVDVTPCVNPFGGAMNTQSMMEPSLT